jgi:hypothetical protein
VLAAGALEVSLSPAAATWRDRVVVTVTGTVVTSCGPGVVQLGAAGAIPPPGSVVALEVFLLPCDVLAPPQAHAFAVSLELPPLPVGEYELRVEDGTAGGEVTTVAFTVHDVSTVEVIPPDVARSDQPVTLRVRSFASCASIDVAPVAAGVVEIEFATTCVITPPGPALIDQEVELGLLPPGLYEVRLFDFNQSFGGVPALATAGFRVWGDAAGCVPSATALCLHEGRFRVEVAWEEFRGGTGAGRPIPLPGLDDSGLFWFFDEENVELTVKVLEACPLDDHWWVFLAGGSTVEYEVTVTDTAAGRSVSYRNELGEVPRLVADTAAFATCP